MFELAEPCSKAFLAETGSVCLAASHEPERTIDIQYPGSGCKKASFSFAE